MTFIIDDETKSIEISSDNGNYKLVGQNASEFPKIPSVDSSVNLEIDSDVLANAINKTLFATGNDELRPVMSGVFCELSSENLVVNFWFVSWTIIHNIETKRVTNV